MHTQWSGQPLPRGRHKLSRAEVLASQRGRLLRAMEELVGEHGYESTTVPLVIKAAHVSTATFYRFFADKIDCFIALCEERGEGLLADLTPDEDERRDYDARELLEILPLAQVKQVPQAPVGIAGLLDYHGVALPVIDLSETATGKSSISCLSTRIILVHYPIDAEEKHLLGLMAERVTETVQIDPAAFNDSGVDVPEASYLGPVTRDARGIIQRIEVKNLLSDNLRNRLFRSTVEHV